MNQTVPPLIQEYCPTEIYYEEFMGCDSDYLTIRLSDYGKKN